VLKKKVRALKILIFKKRIFSSAQKIIEQSKNSNIYKLILKVLKEKTNALKKPIFKKRILKC